MTKKLVSNPFVVFTISILVLTGCSKNKNNEPAKPTVTTALITSISRSSAISGGDVTDNGGSDITTRGVCWSTSSNPTTTDSKTIDGSGEGNFTSNITGLSAGLTYHLRAYAINKVGTAYGEDISFLTPAPNMPTLTTSPISKLTSDSAVSGGTINDDGGSLITARGVCWSTSQNPTPSLSTKTADGSGTGSFISDLKGLTPGTTYYFRAYATNGVGTGYGNQDTFTTKPIVPTVTTTRVSNVSTSSATSGGNIINNGGGSISARGICWSTSPNPTVDLNSKTIDGNGSGTFTSNITGLSQGTIYYYRAYATNSAGTAYGNQDTFLTKSINLPTITTTAISYITDNSANSGGFVHSDGGASITARGICWNTSPNPTISDAKTVDGSGVGSFASSLTGLALNTTYYVRAYATNSAGTAYGGQVSFTTGTAVDIDGNVYHTIKIGSQVWMVENLKTTRYRNGDPITNYTNMQNLWASYSQGAYCIYQNNQSYASTYGYLYNWYAAVDNRDIAPAGWHVPTDQDWTTLETYLGGTSVAGGKMKLNPGTNESGFSALYGGWCTGDLGAYQDIFNVAIWWSSTYNSTYFSHWDVTTTDTFLYTNNSNQHSGYSIRCIHD